MNGISVLILTKNEQQDLPGCLASLAWCDDIHVYDSMSTDDTVKIAEQFGATVTKREFDNWSSHQNWGLSNIPFKHGWVYYSDADERVTPELAIALKDFAKNPGEHVALRVQRRDYLMGKWLKNVTPSPFNIRFFKPTHIRYERLTNPVTIVDGPIGETKQHFDHYPFSKGMTHWLNKHNSYSSSEAGQIVANRKSGSPFSFWKALFSKDTNERRFHQKEFYYRLPFRPLVMFFLLYVVKRGFLDGLAGLTFVFLRSFYEYMIVLKVKELEQANGRKPVGIKILLYSANFAPEPVGIGKYSGEMAAWLAAQGHQVRVVAAPPYYPAWQLATGYGGWPSYRREQWQGVDVWRAPLWVPSRPSGLTRVLHLLTFAISSVPVMLLQFLWRPALVMTVAPALVCAPMGSLARLCGAKTWLHIQDFEVDVAFQMGLLKGKMLQSLVLGMERWLLRRFHVVSSISGSMVERLHHKGVAPEKARFLPNWVDIGHIAPLDAPSPYRAELGIAPGTKVALFSGTLGGKQGLMVIPEAARHLAHRPDIVVVICGDGAMKAQLEEAAKQLPNLILLPLQPFERLGYLLGLADIHLLPQNPEAEDLVLPSKLTGMLASGRPVIATCRAGTEIATVVGQCGLVVPPGDSAALAAAIECLVDDSAQRTLLGQQARRYAETHLAKDAVLARMLSMF